MVDQVVVNFSATNGTFQSVTNWTSYTITRDFMEPTDTFHLVCEDDRAAQLSSELAIGMRLQFVVNNCPILVGYIDTINLSYQRGGRGRTLTIVGRDICGTLLDAAVFPNLGTGKNTDFQFTPQQTLSQALNIILVNGLTTITQIVNEDGTPFAGSAGGSLTFATGFGIGIRAKGKKGRGISKSYTSNLNRLCKPEKGESYLRYAHRLCKHAGFTIKCVPGSDSTLFVGPPTYDRTNPAPFTINHQLVTNGANNAHNGDMKVSYRDQPSVIIGEATHGAANFRKSTFKVVCINELTGYAPGSSSLTVNTAIPNVGQAIGQLTTGVAGTGKYTTTSTITPTYPATQPTLPGTPGPITTPLVGPPTTTVTTVTVPPSGYYLLPPNADLYNALSRTVIGVQTNFSRPHYYVDYNAETPEELMIGVSELMADFQDRFFELEYKLDNHSDPVSKAIWAPNVMCNVTDDVFAPNNQSVANTYWIKKVTFTKSRGSGGGGGTETSVVLGLPYIHVTNLTP
jgi:hypothetical protein